MEVKTSTNSRKRKNNDPADLPNAVFVLSTATNAAKPKNGGKEVREALSKIVGSTKPKERSKKSQNTEDYINFVGDVMYPKKQFGPYGFHPDNLRFPIERVTSLGYLLSTMRRCTVIEKWSPFEISVFEASITLYGKNFNRLQKNIQTKTVQDVIEFYYDWKKTSHYKQWKKNYLPDERDVPTVIGD